MSHKKNAMLIWVNLDSGIKLNSTKISLTACDKVRIIPTHSATKTSSYNLQHSDVLYSADTYLREKSIHAQNGGPGVYKE